MAKIGRHLYVSGRVQGVAFRYSAIRQAHLLGVTGWVKNVFDGRVELLIEGDDAAVREMTAWCYQGPRAAHVTEVEEEILPYSGKYPSFEVRF
ncbi:probable acylphosphatase [Candidatus Vecturithrix granuli]|uniref:Acylphosphatase n=1 Tax=Vecturithrix granuli TaxID=1499967 RepID=A0A081C6P0_VECG1|nr:probable acylphosphatase [Candidatus Vecturithrix granuli]